MTISTLKISTCLGETRTRNSSAFDRNQIRFYHAVKFFEKLNSEYNQKSTTHFKSKEIQEINRRPNCARILEQSMGG